MRLCVFLITNSIVKFCDYFFQHILCCYSTSTQTGNKRLFTIFQYMICCYSTDTILFNFIKSRPFQYIICCYSTINKASLPRTFPNFNTSYVIIQLFRQSSLPLFFNTSYVVIQRKI